MIDAHHHFWRFDPAEYGWIDESMRQLQRDFLPPDLRAEATGVGITGVVSVQARQSLEETAWLLDLARHDDFIQGVVGWVPLISPTVRADLARFAAEPKLKAVRHVLQAEADDHYMLRADFNAGIRALAEFGLVYDILIFERHLPPAIELVDRHPEQVFVLDHVAKPRIKEGALEPWNRDIRELAKRPNVFCKLSGLVTEAAWATWTEDQLRPYFDTVWEAFGPERLMFGSDWPVCLLAVSYRGWFETVDRLARQASAAERARLFGGTATAVYRLG